MIDCGQDLELHDDNSRALDKGKESIFLMKTKMLRSHDLIFQYNHKLKECERLKSDLCLSQEEVIKFKRENCANLSKVVKLEMQSTDFKKNRHELEEIIAEKNIQIAGNKSNLQQLEYKLEAEEEKNTEKAMEAELSKSLLEVKVKELEQEIKSLKKSHISEMNKLGKIFSPTKDKKGKKISEVVKETKDIGVNTIEIVQPKPITTDKSVLTNEFDRIRDNPCAIFCDNCETSMEPQVEKIFKIMSRTPLDGNLLSPIRPSVSERKLTNNLRHNETRREQIVNDTSRIDASLNEINSVDTISRNFVSPLPTKLSINSAVHDNQTTLVDLSVSELDKMRRKIALLERKIKLNKKQQSTDIQQSSANCCNHPTPLNYCGHTSTHVNPSPNAFPNTQTDLMTEFFNRMMNFANQREINEKTTKIHYRQKKQTLRDRRTKIKLRKIKKINTLKENNNRGSSNWEIDDCHDDNDNEKCDDHSDPTKPHLLRIKPVDSPVTLFDNVESEISVQLEDLCEKTFAETQEKSSKNLEKTSEKVISIVRISNQKCTVIPPKNPKLSTLGKKRKKALVFSDDSTSETEIEPIINDTCEIVQNYRDIKSTNTTRRRNKNLRHNENEISLEKSSLEEENATNLTCESTINKSASILSDVDAQEINIISNNLTTSDSLKIDSDSGSECTNVQDQTKLRKRKKMSSPKATKRTRQATFLGKLRALKRNITPVVAQISNITTIHTTRSLSKRKVTEPSESDDSEAMTKEVSSVSDSEPNPCVPIKKQRIAHVPKPSTSPQRIQELPASFNAIKSSDCFDKIPESIDDKQTNDSKTDKSKRLLNRRLAVEKLALIKSKDNEKSDIIGEIEDTVLPIVLPKKRGRGRPPKIKPVVAHPSFETCMKITRKKSMEHKVNLEKVTVIPVSPIKRVTDLKDISKDVETSVEIVRDKDNSAEALKSLENEKTPTNSVTTDSVNTEENLMLHSNTGKTSSTQSICVADASINKTEATRDLPAEKSSASLKTSPAEKSSASFEPSPAADLVAPLESVSGKSPEISISLNQSTVSSSVVTIEKNRSVENLCTKNTSFIKQIDNSSVHTEHYKDESSSVSSVGTCDSTTTHNTDILDQSKNSINNELEDKKIVSTIIDESPASPNATPSSPGNETDDFTIESSKLEQRVSIYDNIVLSTSLEKTAHSTSNNLTNATNKAVIFDKFSFEDNSNEKPIEKPIERSLVVYDTNIYDGLEDVKEENDCQKSANPQFFIETADVAKPKSTKNSKSSVETIKVVKELRSRQVLCSPSTSANNHDLQNHRSSLNNKNNNITSINSDVSQYQRYSGVLSLRNLLNRHLGEQRKKNVVKSTKLRKAGAIKLQEAAERNVKVELVKLAESEEWTSELHQSVISKLRDVHSERTIAKSILDFLVERAKLDEPLDRTHTPPAPVMTTTQQRIVTLIYCLQKEKTEARMFDLIQAGIEYQLFKIGVIQSIETIEYLIRTFTAISRIRKDRERVRILCCDVMCFIGRRAIPVIHTILTIWPEVLPKHGTICGSELQNCLVHLIRSEQPGPDPFPKVKALKRMITIYYEYPEKPMLSNVAMKILIKALHERYSSDLELAIILISKREGAKWALENVIKTGLMPIIKDNSYQWKFEILRLLGFILRSSPTNDEEKITLKFVDLLCQRLDSGEGSEDAQEGLVSALLSLSRHKQYFVKISDSLLKWMPSRELRASTLEQISTFFSSRLPLWWNIHLHKQLEKSNKPKLQKLLKNSKS